MKNFKLFKLLALLVVLIASTNTAWANKTYSAGDVLYYDFTNIPSGGVNYTDENGNWHYSSTSYGKVVTITFTKSVTFKVGDTFAKTEYKGWDNKNFSWRDPDTGSNNCIVFKSDDSGYDWTTYGGGGSTYTVTYNGNGKSSGSVPTDATVYNSGDAVTVAGNTGNMTKSGYVFAGWNTAANGTGTYYAPGATFSITAATTLYAVWFDNNVLSGTNVMFYYQGYCDGNCTNRLVKSQSNPLPGSTDLGSGYGYANAATDDLDEYYYVSNNVSGWGGKANEGIKSAQGGELFVTNNSVTTTAAKTAATTANVVGESLSLSTTCNSATGVYDSKPLYILYYVGSNLISVTHSASTVLAIPASTSAQASTYNVSGLSNGSHTLKTILTDGLIYYIADTDNFDVAHTYSVTLNDNNGGSNNGSATVTYGDAALTVSSHASRAGWNLVGYWTGSGVSGSQVADAAGNLIASVSTWTDENGKWIKADNATIYAHWNQTNSLTVSAGTHVTTVSGSTSPVTLGNSYPISATAFDTGWEFYNWTASPAGNASFTSSTSSSTNVTVSNGSVTVTANAKEIARTVTISSDATKGSVSPSSVTAYISTKSDAIEATPEADFDFNGWSTGGGASIAAGYTTSSNPVKVNATADGTLTATFIENVASGWYLCGNDFGDQWNTSSIGYPLNQKYRGMENVFYRRATVSKDKYHCIHNGTNLYKPSSNTYFSGSGWGNKITLNSTSADANVRFSAAGTYYIIVDTRGTWPIIWYETSDPDRSGYHSVNVSGVENAKGTCKVTLGSTSGFETTRFANGETFYVTITGVSGYIPTITIGGTPTTWWKEQATYTASGTMSTSDIAVTISYTASYAVTFATTTGGSTLTATGPSSTITTGAKVKSGTEIEFTQEPAAGYDFSSWNSASTGDGSDLGGDKDGLTKEITAATSVYPIYSFHTYTGGTLDKKEGSKDGTYSVTYYATSFASKTAPTRTGYSVEGYYKETERTNKVANADGSLNPNKTYTDGSSRWTYTSSIPTLYTQWQANTHDVTLNMNGSYTSNGTATSTYDATSLSSIVAPQRTGYDVEGYYTSAGCATKVADPEGALVANIDGYTGAGGIWTIDDDATLYANWTAITYTITYHLNSGSNPGGAPTSFTIESSLVTLPTPTRTGYNFGGWYTNSGLTGDPVASIAAGSTGNKEYWAKWTAKTTTVTLDQQSGSGGSGSVTATYGSAMPAATMPTYTGYDFGGYYTGTSGSGTQYYTSGGASARLWNFEDATKTLYAKWTAHDYTITYHLNGGTGATNTTYTILSSLITLPTAPTVNKTGYTFGGWYDNSSFTGSAVTSIAAGSTGNKEYWAMWTEKKVSIEPTVNATGDAQGYTASATVGSIGIATTTVLTADAPGEGYRFSTWTLSANLVITSGSVTDRSITVRTNGDGEAVSARADYEIDTYVRIYFRNTGSWGTVKAYVWDSSDENDKNAAWPGQATSTETICGITYNYYEFNREDHPNWDKIIFNDNSSKQTSDLDIAGHNRLSYKFSDTKWYVPTNTFYFVNTEFWDEVKLYHFGGTNGTYLGGWPGIAMDKIGTVTIDGHEYDYYGVADGICSNLDGSYIINNGKDGSSKKQTSNISSISNYLGSFFVANKCFGASSSPSDSDKPSGSWYDAVGVHSATIGCPALLPFADINSISLSEDRVPPGASITATPNMNHKRDVDQAYCWGVYTDLECTSPVNVSFTSLGSGRVQFTVPQTIGTYYLKLTVRASAACNASIDDEEVQSFQVTTSQMVFFKNVPGWASVHFYYLGKAYWNGSVDGDDGLGSGCNTSVDGGAARGMTRIGNSDIYYYDYSGNSAITTHLASNPITYVAFTDNYKPKSEHFSSCQAIYRGDFSECAPMLVPENHITCHKNTSAGDGSAAYYQRGYWTNYMSERSGFSLYIWDQTTSGSGNEVTHHEMTGTIGNNSYTFTYNFANDPNNHSMPYIYGFKAVGCGGSYYGAGSTMDMTNCTDWNLGTGTNNCGLKVAAKLEHKFILTLAGDGHVQVSVEYPVNVGDYRLLYDDNTQHPHPSQFIRKRANGKDTVAMYIRPTATEELKVQYCTGIDGETITWEDYAWNSGSAAIDVSGKADGVYNFYLEQDASGNLSVNTSETKPYSGLYYIRTQSVDGGWNSYKSTSDNLMTYAQYPDDRGYGFNYYKAKWVGSTGSDVTYTIACDYSPSLSDTLVADPGNNPLSAAEARNLPHSANIRFGWHSKTNQLKREYINGSSIVSDRYLVMIGDEKLKDSEGEPLAISGLNANEIGFTDLNNWIYRCDVTAVEGAKVKLIATYDSYEQYFIGTSSEGEEIIGGTDTKEYLMRVTYDFKTNRLMTAWLPNGAAITSDVELKADMMLIREGQNAATQVYFGGTKENKITDIHTIFGVMQFNYSDIVGKFSSWSSPNAYKFLMYYVSFPFDVKVSEIFGAGVRGKNWIIQKYNGAKRAQIGWFAETSTFWETLPGDSILHANEGYMLILDRVSFNNGSSSIWTNLKDGNSVYLYFPSASRTIGTIKDNNEEVTIKIPSHTCEIERRFTPDIDGWSGGELVHSNTDSHWNVFGTPLFQSKAATIVGESELKYFYSWNYTDNTLRPRVTLAGDTVFKSMHGYMVQFAGNVTFTGAHISASVVARRMPSNKHYLAELQLVNENGDENATYVELRENANTDFQLNEDMYMMRSSNTVDLYSFAGAYDVAANVLPIDDQLVRVGVDVKRAGTYRFTMQSEFSGTVTLIDNLMGTRTNMALGDHEVYLERGVDNNRFFLEININKMPTAIDGVDGGSLKDGKAHKFIENGQMYILKDGIIYDAQGRKIK